MLFFLLLCWLQSYSVHVRVYWLGVLVDLLMYIIMAKFGKNDDGDWRGFCLDP